MPHYGPDFGAEFCLVASAFWSYHYLEHSTEAAEGKSETRLPTPYSKAFRSAKLGLWETSSSRYSIDCGDGRLGGAVHHKQQKPGCQRERVRAGFSPSPTFLTEPPPLCIYPQYCLGMFSPVVALHFSLPHD